MKETRSVNKHSWSPVQSRPLLSSPESPYLSLLVLLSFSLWAFEKAVTLTHCLVSDSPRVSLSVPNKQRR